MNKDKKLKNIKNGIVIDHITPGWGFVILLILGIRNGTDKKVSTITNVKSSKIGKKDLIKIEDISVEPSQLNVVAIVAPNATISIIKDYEVAEKHKVALPKEVIKGVFLCLNPNCVSHYEPVSSKFMLTKGSREKFVAGSNQETPFELKCYYCERNWEITKLIQSTEVIRSKEAFEFIKNTIKIKKGS